MNILQLFNSSLGSNPRPTRVNTELRKWGKVTVCSAPPTESFDSSEIEFIPLKVGKYNASLVKKCIHAAKIFLRQYEGELWPEHLVEQLQELKHREFNLIVCQDILLLPLAMAVKNLSQNKDSCKLIMDAREFYPRQLEHDFMWRLRWQKIMDYICKTYMGKTDTVFTVSTGFADAYKKIYGIDCELLPSLSYYHELVPTINSLPLKCIHHGIAAHGRKIELMIEAFKPLEGKASLDLMLICSEKKYFESLLLLVKDIPHINIIPPVQMPEIISYTSKYDLGIFLLPDNTFNHRETVANKLYEFIQARLGVIVSPTPGMLTIVNRYKVGLVTANYSPQSLTKAILSLTPEMIDVFKQNSNIAAKELCWEKNSVLIQNVISKLVLKK